MAGRTATSLLPPIMALLFLLAGLVTVTAEPHLATAGMMPQGMMSSRSLQADAATNCPAEVATCYADATCETCFSAFTTASDECFSNAQSCSSALDGFCCAITAEEEEDCQRSDLVIEVLDCMLSPFFTAVSCELDITSDCSVETASSGASSLGVTIVLSSTLAVAGLLMATFGVVV